MSYSYSLCGNCLHSKSSHEPHNGHFMYCACCFRLCEISEFEIQHKPTEYKEVVRIGALKQ